MKYFIFPSIIETTNKLFFTYKAIETKMSRRVQTTNKTANVKTANVKKPHCKVCFDAKKSESEYSSHWVRSSPDRYGNSIVICPTLLNTECKYCYKKGHTAKFCPVIKKNEKEERKPKNITNQKTTKITEKKPLTAKKILSTFAALAESDTDEETEESVRKAESPVKTAWAEVVSKPIQDEREEDTKFAGFVTLTSHYSAPKKTEEEKPMPKPTTGYKIVMKSWADWSDSEEED